MKNIDEVIIGSPLRVRFVLLCVCIALASLAGCTTSTPEAPPDKTAFVASGPADDGFDPCEEWGWYGDGICDGFCDNPDPDCACETAAGTWVGAGDSIWEGCNACLCGADGEFTCSARASCAAARCTWDGLSYVAGERVPVDTCNACTCQEDGEIICTELACAPVAGRCVHEGEEYEPGESFTEDCNRCTCQSDGSIACTELACAPAACEHGGNTYLPGEGFTLDCNRCTCQASGEIICTELACAPE